MKHVVSTKYAVLQRKGVILLYDYCYPHAELEDNHVQLSTLKFMWLAQWIIHERTILCTFDTGPNIQFNILVMLRAFFSPCMFPRFLLVCVEILLRKICRLRDLECNLSHI